MVAPEAPQTSSTSSIISVVLDPALAEQVAACDRARRQSPEPWARGLEGAAGPLPARSSAERGEGIRGPAAPVRSDLGLIREVEMTIGPVARQSGMLRRLHIELAPDAGAEGSSYLRPGLGQPGEEVAIAVLAERFVDGTVRPFLLRELEHLDEALDVSFGYEAARAVAAVDPAIEARVRLLWDVHVEHMLARRALVAFDESLEERLAVALGLTSGALDALGRRLASPQITFAALAELGRHPELPEAADRMPSAAVPPRPRCCS